MSSAGAPAWDVCAAGCRYDNIPTAVGAAGEGATIRVGPGTYAGGLVIDKGVRLVGAGASRTIIRGGGPVITIGSFGAATEPTVVIRGVTITGGIARTSPFSTAFTGAEGVWASGGGVEIPPAADFAPGATVTIVDSAITDNRVAPSNTLALAPPCPTGGCLFAGGVGGGIDDWGNLTLIRTDVSSNRVGAASGLTEIATEATGGAINHWGGDLTLTDSTFDDNTVSVTAPNGRFANAGAIFALNGTITMRHDKVRFNTASVAAALPDDVFMEAGVGGVHVAGGITAATINDTKITHNTVVMTNSVGDASAFSGGLHTDVVNATLDGVEISHNTVVSTTLDGSTGRANADSGAGEIGGTINNSRIDNNTVTIRSAAGDAGGGGGAMIFFDGTLTNTTVNNNRLEASSPHGTVTVTGGGLVSDGPVTIATTTVNGNTLHASGITGSARGGGIFDSPIPDGPQGGPLALTDSSVSRNTIDGPTGVTLSGGGIFTSVPVDVGTDNVRHNSPDQCVGC